MALLPLSATEEEAQHVGGYTILISSDTSKKPEWRKVAAALQDKYQDARVKIVKNLTEEAICRALKETNGRYAALVTQPEETDRKLVLAMHRATRRLDDDIWGDCLWGIITGHSAKDALRIAKAKKPLVIKRLLGTTNVGWHRFERSFCITDWTDAPVLEQTGYQEPTQTLYTDKTAKGRKVLKEGLQTLFAEELEKKKPQLIVTSSHATQFNLEMPFSRGLIFPAGKRFYQLSPDKLPEFAKEILPACLSGNTEAAIKWAKKNKLADIRPDGTTRVWLAAGNCLFGDVCNSGSSMAATALSSYTCNQVVGYVVPSWYGAGGWGTLGTLMDNVAGTTLAQAWFLNNQMILARTQALNPKLLDIQFNDPQFAPATLLKQLMDAQVPLVEEQLKDTFGLVHDRDVVAFYGDPAWSATPDEEHSSSPLSVVWNNADSFTITANRTHNGQCAIFFPPHINGVIGCNDTAAICADNFILWQKLPLAAGESKTVQLKIR